MELRSECKSRCPNWGCKYCLWAYFESWWIILFTIFDEFCDKLYDNFYDYFHYGFHDDFYDYDYYNFYDYIDYSIISMTPCWPVALMMHVTYNICHLEISENIPWSLFFIIISLCPQSPFLWLKNSKTLLRKFLKRRYFRACNCHENPRASSGTFVGTSIRGTWEVMWSLSHDVVYVFVGLGLFYIWHIPIVVV